MRGIILEWPALDVFGQMAADEAVAVSRPEEFAVRFFDWSGAGATFGYAQTVSEVERALPPGTGTNYTRRPTGGGIVPHFSDLTFSCVFPDGGVLSPAQLYARLHSAISAGLCLRGIGAELYSGAADYAPSGPQGASRCFEKPVAQDLMSGGSKILGGAIRRFGNTVLYQGSLQLPGARARAKELELVILRCLAAQWELKWASRRADEAMLAAAGALREKYISSQWIRKL
ncbi:MAG: hypothetical protein PHW69_01510 [Elusimicrobiaceae bacterium]|nr:hypothetical protein [Elusimicrobiaceae bacterium]